MTLRLARTGETDSGAPQGGGTGPAAWACAFVNNIPDGAFVATEHQFLDLLDAAAGSDAIEVRRFAMAGVPRGERTSARIAELYSPLEEIWTEPPDLLIVTGSEPLASAIEDEPYWSDLAELLSTATGRVSSMLLSCLSAHAALLVFDGLARTQMDAKCTGVFPQDCDAGHPLAAGLVPPIVLPHSRMNTVPTDLVRSAGYGVALESDATGWSVASRVVDKSNVVLVQGHPEYGPSSLLAEYYRDAKRYVNRERDEVPRLPIDCAADEDWAQLQRMQGRFVDGDRDPALVESFPLHEAGARAGWPWRAAATRLYTNWLAGVPKRSD
jgi:homoserine O-succinyltransferase